MKNITLSAKDDVIDELRRISKQQNMTVNDLFRQWSEEYIMQTRKQTGAMLAQAFDESRKRLEFRGDRKFTRDEMNER